jgi:hypothetical protein
VDQNPLESGRVGLGWAGLKMFRKYQRDDNCLITRCNIEFLASTDGIGIMAKLSKSAKSF